MKEARWRRQTLTALIALSILVLPAVQAQPARYAVNTSETTLSYTGHHTLHSWTGTSTSVSGFLMIDPEQPAESSIEIAVPVESFDSGNGNRDSNMLDAVEADRYPEIRFNSDGISVDAWQQTDSGYTGTWTLHGTLAFHGKEQRVDIPADVTIEGTVVEAHSTFPVSLEQFDVRRPRLLLMPISDTIDITGTIRADIGANEQVNQTN